MELKQCRGKHGCGLLKPRAEFSRRKLSRDGLQYRCKPCDLKQNRAWVAKNRQQRAEYRCLYDYGVTLDVVYKAIDDQGGKCPICGDPVSREDHVKEHCHTTGKFRGATCRYCNTVLGMARDNPETLRNAAAYLERAANG